MPANGSSGLGVNRCKSATMTTVTTPKRDKRREYGQQARCSVCSLSVVSVRCGDCLKSAIENPRLQMQEECTKTEQLRSQLSDLLESKRNDWQSLHSLHSRMISRIEKLRDRCAGLRDDIYEERIDAADLRYRIMERDLKLREAWYILGHKRTELVTWVLDPLVCCLRDELESRMDELAEARREKVLQASPPKRETLTCCVVSHCLFVAPHTRHSHSSTSSLPTTDAP